VPTARRAPGVEPPLPEKLSRIEIQAVELVAEDHFVWQLVIARFNRVRVRPAKLGPYLRLA
jgi:hypothetical protein